MAAVFVSVIFQLVDRGALIYFFCVLKKKDLFFLLIMGPLNLIVNCVLWGWMLVRS
jgi:hypothetical protein